LTLESSIDNISPVDGRYRREAAKLQSYCSEFALMKYRLAVEARYLEALARALGVRSGIAEEDVAFLKEVCASFDKEDALEVKAYEEKVGHDVVAVVEYLKYRSRREGRPMLVRFLHFGLTSDDINNIAYSLMLRDAIYKVYLPALLELCEALSAKALEFRDLAMLSHTHGQPATPTTLGKEFANYLVRLSKAASRISRSSFPGKLGGAVGNLNALKATYPEVDWLSFAEEFVSSFELEPTPFTTQALPHDDISLLLDQLALVNSIVQNLDVDVWLYCSKGYLGTRSGESQVGSSTMPHKVNPIDFENSEGNAKLANALLGLLSGQLQSSRLQRDLSDSTLKRNYGVALAHSVICLSKARVGLTKLEARREVIARDLAEHAEVLGELLQHFLKKAGRESAYEEVAKLIKGKSLTLEELKDLIRTSPVSEALTTLLTSARPENYVGYAADLVGRAVELSSKLLRDARKVVNGYVPFI